MRKKIRWRKPLWPWLTALFFISLLLGAVLLPRTGLQRCYGKGELILSATLPEVEAVTAAASPPLESSPAAQAMAGGESILILPPEDEAAEAAAPTGEPRAVIYCTHAGENYKGEKRVNGKAGGVMKAARALAEGLEDRGVAVIFDETVHDSPSYDEAYASSLSTISAIHAQYPDIALYIDIHRDATIHGVNTRFTNENGSYAKMLLVIGTDEKYEHPRWQENYDFARKVYAELEELQPGIGREPRTSSNRYNQHIAEKAILVEIGSDANSVEEAIRSADILAEALCNVMGW